MVDAKKYQIPDIQLASIIIKILDEEQKPVNALGFSILIDGNGMSTMTDNEGVLNLPKPKNKIILSLAGEWPNKNDEKVETPESLLTPEEPVTTTDTTLNASNYTLKGEVLSRLTWAKDAKDDAFLNRKNYDPAKVYAIKNVLIRVFEEGKNQLLAEIRTDSKGLFEFKQLFEEGKEYSLFALLKNDSERLREEQVTIKKIRFPEAGGEATINLIQTNSPPKDKNHISTEDESIQPAVKTAPDGSKTLEFTKNAAILFNTFMLNVPYINQNASPVNIDGNGEVRGGIVCFPTSMAMMMGYYGLKPNTTQLMAEEVYRMWKDEGFPDREAGDGIKKYIYKGLKDMRVNIWEVWIWENRAARSQANRQTKNIWKDIDKEDELPAGSEWRVYWVYDKNLMKQDSAIFQYLRLHVGRGYPLVVGTDATSGGHIMIIRGFVLRNNGSIYKIIFNDPYGDLEANPDIGYKGGINKDDSDSDRGRSVYYDVNTKGSHNTFSIRSHLTMRRGMTRDDVRDNKVVYPSIQNSTAASPKNIEPSTTDTPKPEETLLSGKDWVSKFPGSKSLNDLDSNFKNSVEKFIGALKSAGANVTINATKRPIERAYMMHYSWLINKKNQDASKIQPHEGVNINWWHGNQEKSKAAALEMVVGFGLTKLETAPALKSNHIAGKAIDMDISWNGDLKIRKKDGSEVTITSLPKDGTNRELIEIAKTYDVIHFKCFSAQLEKLGVKDPWDKKCVEKDRPHWSINGG